MQATACHSAPLSCPTAVTYQGLGTMCVQMSAFKQNARKTLVHTLWCMLLSGTCCLLLQGMLVMSELWLLGVGWRWRRCMRYARLGSLKVFGKEAKGSGSCLSVALFGTVCLSFRWTFTFVSLSKMGTLIVTVMLRSVGFGLNFEQMSQQTWTNSANSAFRASSSSQR